MATQLVLSGTLSCPNCKPGTFQPAFTIPGLACLCIGAYTVTGSVDCHNVNGVFECKKSAKTVMKLGQPAKCNCPKPSQTSPLTSSPACNCGKIMCVPVKKVKVTKS